MRRQTGLRRRLASSFALFGAALAILYGTLVVVVFHDVVDVGCGRFHRGVE